MLFRSPPPPVLLPTTGHSPPPPCHLLVHITIEGAGPERGGKARNLSRDPLVNYTGTGFGGFRVLGFRVMSLGLGLGLGVPTREVHGQRAGQGGIISRRREGHVDLCTYLCIKG